MNNKSIKLKFRELGKHGLIYGIGTALESFLNFLLLPFFLNRFLPEVFGAFALIQLTATMSGAFFYFGGSSALSRFYFENEKNNGKEDSFSNSLLITCLGATLMVLISFFFTSEILRLLIGKIEYIGTFRLMFLSAAITIINTNFYILIRLQKKSTWFISLKLTNFLISFFYIIIAANYFEDISFATASGFLIGNVLVLVIMILKLIKFIKLNFNIKVAFSFLRFGFPIALSSLIFYLFDWTIRYFVQINLSLNELGLFSMGLKIGALIQAGFIVPFSLIWSTTRMEYRKDDNTPIFFNMVSSYFILIGIFIVFFISILIKDIISLISTNLIYESSIQIVPVILLAQLTWGTINIFDFGMYVKGKTMYYILYHLFSLFIVAILSFLFIKSFGIIGASFISFIGYFIIASLIYRKSNQFFRIYLNFKLILLYLLGAILLYFLFLISRKSLDNNFINKIIVDISISFLFLNYTYILIIRQNRDKFFELFRFLITRNQAISA